MLKICLTGWMNSSVSVYKAHVQVICQSSVCSRFFGILDHVSMPFRIRHSAVGPRTCRCDGLSIYYS